MIKTVETFVLNMDKMATDLARFEFFKAFVYG